MKKNVLLSIGIIAAVAILSLTSTCQAYTVGYTGKGSSNWFENRIITTQWNITVPDGYAADIQSFHIYSENSSSHGHVRGAIYDSYLCLIGQSEEATVAGSAAWYNMTMDIEVQSGVYYLAAAYDSGALPRYNTVTTVIANDTHATYAFPNPITQTECGNYAFSAYVTYELVPLGTGDVFLGGSVVYSLALLACIGVSLALFKLRLGVVGIVWGITCIAITGALVGNQSVPLYPFLTISVGLVGMLLVFYSGFQMRGAS